VQRILVTGGTGFTGSHLVRDLIARGNRVQVLTRSAERGRKILPHDVELFEGDVADADAVRRAMSGVEIVYHLAAAFREAGIRDRRYWDVHVQGTRNVLEAASTAGVARVVHCSTVGVLSHIAHPPADETWPHSPGDIYQETKSEAEQLALQLAPELGVSLAVARPTPIYGPGDERLLKLFRLIARGRFVMLGSGKPFYHMIHVDDLVRGFELLAEHPAAEGEIFILGGADYKSLDELAELIRLAVSGPPLRWRLPAWPVQLAGSLCEKVCLPLGIEPPIYRRRVDFFTKSRAFSIEKAKRVIGYAPQIDLETGIRKTAEWYFERGWIPARATHA
jgi:nucleoside-diphosphate-sugar epimerase